MNTAIIFRLISVILLTLTLCFALSFGVGLVMNQGTQTSTDIAGWSICLGISGGLSLLFYMLGYGGSSRMFRREAMAVIGLGWLAASMVGALPYLILIPECSFADAFFESSSGLTTTGATAFPDLHAITPGLMFWRCMSQWIGGLGVVVFFVALLSFLGAGAKILYSNEASAHSTDLDTSRVQSGVLRIFALYAILSLSCALAYRLADMEWYDAIVHMFTTVSTGGFSPYPESKGWFESPLLEWICIVFMVLGGTSFLAMLKITRWRREDLKRITEVYIYLLILTAMSLIVSLFLHAQRGWTPSEDILRTSTFHVVSIMTSTGYATEDYMLWPRATHVILLTLMVVGGCTGSTAGGLKVVRLIVAFKVCLRQIERSIRPRVVRPISINGRVMDEPTLEQGTVLLVLAATITTVSIPIVGIMEPGMSVGGTVSAVFACIFNIGPALNELGPTEHYGNLHSYTKVFLSLLMILGRLEFYALLVLLMPSMWRQYS